MLRKLINEQFLLILANLPNSIIKIKAKTNNLTGQIAEEGDN